MDKQNNSIHPRNPTVNPIIDLHDMQQLTFTMVQCVIILLEQCVSFTSGKSTDDSSVDPVLMIHS